MRTTQTLLGNKARKAVLDGVNAIYHAVRPTLGPQAKKALLYRTFGRGNRIVDDGYMVAECQEPRNQFARMAAQTFREGTKRTNEIVGDGTTTTTVIGGKLMNDVAALLSESSSSIINVGGKSKDGKGMGVMTLRENILKSATDVKAKIKERAHKIESLEDLEKVAMVSIDDPEVGKAVAKMAWEVGEDGFIDVVEGYKGKIETEINTGFRFAAKVAAKVFINNPARFEMIANDCPVLITNYALENPKQVADFVSPIIQAESKVIIIAPKFSDDVLMEFFKAMYTINKDGVKVKRPIDIFPVHTPSLRTDQFEDLAIYCGAKFFDKAKGISITKVSMEDAGFIEKLIVKDVENKEDAMASGGKGLRSAVLATSGGEIVAETSTPVEERIKVLKGQLDETRQEQFKILLQRRIASMASALGVIRVGDSTQASSLYRKLKIEDGVNACKAALRGGYVKGGGLCLKEIAETLPENDILKSALEEPYNIIQASVDGGIEISPDIIDPAEMIYYAVEHATQIVANLATVEIITPETEDPIHGEGEFAIARAIQEFVISNKRHLGQLKDNEEEIMRDAMGGMTVDETLTLDNG